jgi:CBS domain-containing protein
MTDSHRERAAERARVEVAEGFESESSLNMPLGDLIARPPIWCAPDVSLQAAVQRLHAERIGSIVICDPAQRPLGIFTLHDLRAVVASGDAGFDEPIARFMTPSPLGLPPEARAFDAAILMAGRHFGHVCVIEGGRLVGVVSERDLFALQRVKLVQLTRTISQAADVAALVAMRPRIRQLMDTFLVQGVGVEQLTRIITLLNDQTVSRIIELTLASRGKPDIPFAWIAFGSEGRREQTLSTDQDNGILFLPAQGRTCEQAREQLLPLASAINKALAECGFPLCKGNVMASNPALCLSAQEWRSTFAEMIEHATPENLLRSSIYFDLRGIWGEVDAVRALQQSVLEQSGANTIFQHMMAANALRTRPPLGLIRDFAVERDRGGRATLDLKLQGLTLFVDAARILALSHGVVEANTLDRLRALVASGVLAEADSQAWSTAFCFIQLLRMRTHQTQLRLGEPLSNRLDPDSLNPLDRRILREALRQAKGLQRRLELQYRL